MIASLHGYPFFVGTRSEQDWIDNCSDRPMGRLMLMNH
jgi:hypothetical protein